MFSPLPMKHVLFQVLTEDLPQVSLTLAELAVFSPDYRPVHDEQFPTIPGQRFREIYNQACSRLEKISKHVSLSDQVRLKAIHVISERELEKTNNWLGKVWARCSAFEETFDRLTDKEHMVEQLEQALDNFSELNLDLSLLQGEKLFLDIHVGIIPRTNVAQLKEAVGLADYLLFPYMEHGENAHVIVVGPKGRHEEELESVLDTAGFNPLPIPPELHAEPEKVRAELQVRRGRLAREREKEAQNMASCAEELRGELEQARGVLVMAEPFVRIDTAARSSGHLSVISGWIPARDLRRTKKALRQRLTNPFHIDSRSPTAEERPLVPSYMPKNRIMVPFATLVKQYGVPRYGEVDPTLLFALSFIVMFGMMFGDVGHGLTIIAIGWLARRKLKSFSCFAVCIGISATVFGVLYGSVFGYEELFHAVWIPPLSDPLYMLSVALIWGIGFLLLITLIAIYNRVVQNEILRAIFDSNGLVSIALYLSTLGGVYNLYRNGEFGLPATAVSIGALLTLLGYKLVAIKAPPSERLLVALIETFETVTSYVSNTLSFLRVAAFSLNHVALAIAVFTLVEMITSAHGRLLMVIFGNIFILILEGAIVTIQALRLEYYEGFSRFYSGDGQEFKPLKLETGDSA